MRLVLESIRRVARLLEGTRRWPWTLLVVLAVSVTALEAVAAFLIFGLVGLVAGEESGLSVPLFGDLSGMFPQVGADRLNLWAALAVAVFFVVRALVVMGQIYQQSRLVENAAALVADRLVTGYLWMPYAFHLQRSSSTLIRNAFDSTQQLARQVLTPLVRLVGEAVVVVGMVVVLLIVSPIGTLLAVIGLAPVVWVIMRVIQPRLKVLGREAQDARRDTLGTLQDALRGIRDIRLVGVEDRFADRFAQQRRRLARTEYLRNFLGGTPRSLIESALVLVIVGIFVVAILLEGVLGELAAVLGAFAYVGFRLQTSLRVIAQQANELRFGSAVLEDLLGDLALLESDSLRQRAGHGPVEPREPFNDRLELREVGFSYPATDRPVLDSMDLVIERGQFVGLCGETGSGKSTVVDLLVGLLTPTSGDLLVDGQSVRGHERWWQQQVGLVSQNIYLLDGTVRDNVVLGRSQSSGRLEEVVEAAQLGDVVEGLPAGLDTMLGEDGTRLSGGQRQRIAVARALYGSPEVLVFDEGTSALDVPTETALVRSIERLQEGRTLIAIAHRVSTLRGADRILVFDQGRIVAEGTYEELMATSPQFRELAS